MRDIESLFDEQHSEMLASAQELVEVEDIAVKHERCRVPAIKSLKRRTKVFRTPAFKAKLISIWDLEKVKLMSPEERQKWLDKHGCPWNTFRKWLKHIEKWISRFIEKNRLHSKQKKGLFVEQQEELVRKITAKRARGLPVTSLWCRITMRNLVHEFGDESGAKTFKASCQWFNSFRKRWGFTFQEKTNVKKSSVEARLPYVRKFHQYL